MNVMSFEVIKYTLFGTLLLTYECRSSANFYMGPKLDSPRVVTGEKNSPTVSHTCRKRRLKWVLPR